MGMGPRKQFVLQEWCPLTAHEQTDQANAALSVELSRQLAHDFSNFLFNVLLQIEIWENSPHALAAECQHLKREGKKIASLLQQWQQLNDKLIPAAIPPGIDLHHLLRQAAANVAADDPVVDLAPDVMADALMIQEGAAEIKHLVRLLLEDALALCKTSADSRLLKKL